MSARCLIEGAIRCGDTAPSFHAKSEIFKVCMPATRATSHIISSIVIGYDVLFRQNRTDGPVAASFRAQPLPCRSGLSECGRVAKRVFARCTGPPWTRRGCEWTVGSTSEPIDRLRVFMGPGSTGGGALSQPSDLSPAGRRVRPAACACSMGICLHGAQVWRGRAGAHDASANAYPSVAGHLLERWQLLLYFYPSSGKIALNKHSSTRWNGSLY